MKQAFTALLLVGLLFTTYLAHAQTIRYVKPAATGAGNGSSWADATADLQSMINASGASDQVWVAVGTYKPTTTTGPASRTISFSMKADVAILGGFAGTETTLAQRRLAYPNLSVLSGDIGVVGTDTDNSLHVIANLTSVTGSQLDGFLITGGNANDGAATGTVGFVGGGVYNSRAGNLTFRNCAFVGNKALQNTAGAVYNANGVSGAIVAQFINCLFLNNRGALHHNTSFSGGGPGPCWSYVTNCSFFGNGVVSYTNKGSEGTMFRNCVLFNNGPTFIDNDPPRPLNPPLPRVTNSVLETGTTTFAGSSNQFTSTSPFLSPTDLRLHGNSNPALNLGDPATTATQLGTNTDLWGNPRVYLNRVDAGAYEFFDTASGQLPGPK